MTKINLDEIDELEIKTKRELLEAALPIMWDLQSEMMEIITIEKFLVEVENLLNTKE